MIGGFLDKIGGFFDRGFVLAALFPLLTVAFLVGVGGAALLGFGASLLWLDALSGEGKAALAAFATIALFLGAFVLRSLRGAILALWRGAGAPQFWINREARRREALEQTVETAPVWQDATAALRDSAPYARRGLAIPAEDRDRLLAEIGQLAGPAGELGRVRAAFQDFLTKLKQAYELYDGDSLIPVYQRARAFVEAREAGEAFSRQTLRVELGLNFGPPGMVQGTRLGNILAALDHYPFKRYHMEGGIFWPHLEQVMKGDLLDDMRDQRTLLDLVLALASLFALLAMTALAVGPWIWLNWVWPVAAVIAGALSFCFYRVAIQAAISLSRVMRAGCDLFRRDLLASLGIALPETLGDERTAWERLSRLLAYGETRYLSFQSPPATTSK